ncbi:MAG: putative methyltransferase [uncultured marine phage]|uniref:Putative methyltransferase n=1 Tax=uncultured marine phage TaxID=707152 RepID=A0A8D9FR62_9VIRU|nr:MAG: putative methyltransferase [uncultured marine phage]
MNIKYLGTEYGGWTVDVDSINDGDVVISGGVGEDISFDESLMNEKNVKIIFVDPTEKSHKFMEGRVTGENELLKMAITEKSGETIKMFKNKNPEWVSESVSNTHDMVGEGYHEAETISITDLVEKYNPTLIKIDIEGSEYDVLKQCIGVKQICVEFHHHCMTDKTYMDTLKCVNEMNSNGYTVIKDKGNMQEVTFLKK